MSNRIKQEMKKNRKKFNVKVIVIAVLLISVGAFTLFDKDGSVETPVIQLPADTANADMIGLIVYNGKTYTQTRTEIDAENVKAIIGDKLGTTKGTIDE